MPKQSLYSEEKMRKMAERFYDALECKSEDPELADHGKEVVHATLAEVINVNMERSGQFGCADD